MSDVHEAKETHGGPRIGGWSVDGFGHFQKHTVTDLPGGLIAVFGENEAGKSTLLAFLRGVLFGFPDGRSNEPKYEPLYGGRHGGRVFIDTGAGRWTVEREAGRGKRLVVTSPGGPATEAALGQLLGGADATLYRNVFAFGLSELQALRSQQDDTVRARILAAGIVGAGRSARTVASNLADAAGELFISARGRTQRLPRLRHELAAVDQRLRTARGALAGHADLVRQEAAAREDADRIRLRLGALADEDAGLAALLELWPVWRDRAAALEELDTVERVDTFPPDAAARLERRLGDVDAARERMDAACNTWREYGSDRRAAVRGLDARLRDVADAANDCHARIELHRAQLVEATAAGAALEAADMHLADKMRDLGADWDEARLTASDTSLPLQSALRAFEERLRAAEMRVQEAAREARAAEVTAGESESAYATLRAKLDAEPAVAPAADGAPRDAARMDADDRAIDALRRNLGGRDAARARRDGIETLIADRARALEDAAIRPAPPPRWAAAERWLWIAAAVLAVVAIGLVALDALGILGPGASGAVGTAGMVGAAGVTGSALVVGGALVAGVLALACAVAAFVVRRKAGSAAAARAAALRTAAATRADRERAVGQAREQLAAVDAALAELDAAIGRDATALGLADPVTAVDVDDAARALRVVRDTAARRALLVAETDKAAATAGLAATELERTRAASDRARGERDAVAAEWSDYRRGAGLPETLAPAAALDFVREVQAARERLRARDAARRRLDALHEATGRWEHAALAVVRRLDRSIDARGDELVTQLGGLHERVGKDAAARRKSAELRAAQRRAKGEVRAARAAYERASEALAALLDEGGAADEAAFRRRLAASERRAALSAKLAECDTQIDRRLGADAAARAARAELAAGRRHDWEGRRATIAEERARLEQERDARMDDQGRLRTLRETLELSGDVPALEVDAATLRTEIADAVRRWTVVTVAKSLVEQTLERYVRERQPGVLRAAGRRFEQITRGRYGAVMQDGDGENVVTLDAEGRRRAPEQLSRGTAEQLYLSLRLALAEEFAGHGTALPLVMDDVLVNFDGRRAHATAATLADVAQSHQVLVFTCHRPTLRMLRRYGATEIRLDGGGGGRRD